MIVKDPLMWMASSCRHGYIMFRKTKETCPYPFEISKTTLDTEKHESLVHVWSRFILAYMNAPFPVLILRYEDLLYRAEEVVGAVCGCIGGEPLQGEAFGALETSA